MSGKRLSVSDGVVTLARELPTVIDTDVVPERSPLADLASLSAHNGGFHDKRDLERMIMLDSGLNKRV